MKKKFFKKGTLKPKIDKGFCYPFFTVFFSQIFAGEKILNFSPSSLKRRDHIVLIKIYEENKEKKNNLIIFWLSAGQIEGSKFDIEQFLFCDC